MFLDINTGYNVKVNCTTHISLHTLRTPFISWIHPLTRDQCILAEIVDSNTMLFIHPHSSRWGGGGERGDS